MTLLCTVSINKKLQSEFRSPVTGTSRIVFISRIILIDVCPQLFHYFLWAGGISTSTRQAVVAGGHDFKNMKRKLIIDTRRILSGKNLNAEYYALGMGN